MKLKSRKKKGFTLPEIVITFTLALALIMGISSMVMSGMKINSESGEKQSGSQYAQQILERFISLDIQKTLSDGPASGYNLKFGDMILEGSNKNEFSVSDYNLDNFNISGNEKIAKGYKADITVTRNSSGIGTGVQNSASVSSKNECTLYVVGKGENASINEDKNSSLLGGISLSFTNNVLNIIVDVEKTSSGKTLSINNSVLKTFTDEDAIRLNLDFSMYDLNSTNVKFNIVINNKDTKALNLCLQGSSTLSTEDLVNVNTKKGKVLIYDNRGSDSTSSDTQGDLYDITIKIKNNKSVVYEKTISRNLVIVDSTI